MILDVAFTSCLPALISPYWLPLGYKLFPLFIFIILISFYCFYFSLFFVAFELFLVLLFIPLVRLVLLFYFCLLFYLFFPIGIVYLGHQLCLTVSLSLLLFELIVSLALAVTHLQAFGVSLFYPPSPSFFIFP